LEEVDDASKIHNLMVVKNQVHVFEIFNIKFYEPRNVDLTFRFKNCSLELSNILLRFGILGCKSVSLFMEDVNYNFCEQESPLRKKNKDMYVDSDEEIIHK
jgi:hypothetical protein